LLHCILQQGFFFSIALTSGFSASFSGIILPCVVNIVRFQLNLAATGNGEQRYTLQQTDLILPLHHAGER
jgi:hypothetical protein